VTGKISFEERALIDAAMRKKGGVTVCPQGATALRPEYIWCEGANKLIELGDEPKGWRKPRKADLGKTKIIRERRARVCKLVAEGFTTRQIAEKLGMNPDLVRRDARASGVVPTNPQKVVA